MNIAAFDVLNNLIFKQTYLQILADISKNSTNNQGNTTFIFNILLKTVIGFVKAQCKRSSVMAGKITFKRFSCIYHIIEIMLLRLPL